MEDGVEALLELAADTEMLQDSLADVDLSSAEVEDGEEEEEREEEEDDRDAEPSRRGSRNLPASSVLMSPSSAATSAAAAAAGTGGSGGSASVAGHIKDVPTLRNTSWDKDAGNEDTTEV